MKTQAHFAFTVDDGHAFPLTVIRVLLPWQVRGYPCTCQWPEHCDSQQSSLPPTRMAQKVYQPQPAAPTLNNEVHLEQLRNASAAPQQLSNAPATSLDSFQAASGWPPGQTLQPSEQCLVGRQSEADAAALGFQHSDAVGGQPQIETRQNGSQLETEADLQRLEQEFVHDVYNAIAPHFSATRFAIWPKVMNDCCAPFVFSIES